MSDVRIGEDWVSVLPEKLHQSQCLQYPKREFAKAAVQSSSQPFLAYPWIKCFISPAELQYEVNLKGMLKPCIIQLKWKNGWYKRAYIILFLCWNYPLGTAPWAKWQAKIQKQLSQSYFNQKNAKQGKDFSNLFSFFKWTKKGYWNNYSHLWMVSPDHTTSKSHHVKKWNMEYSKNGIILHVHAWHQG